jgi:cyclopropane-fatty-acyl-phospholipid synthase
VLTLEEGTLYEFLAFCVDNLRARRSLTTTLASTPAGRLAKAVLEHNPRGLARKHVAHHYELSDALFDRFLDMERQYSCAYFRRPEDDLETAQRAKMDHIAAKLLLRDGQRVLDIGSGWGGLGLRLAQCADVGVTGVTLSPSQQAVANRRAAQVGLSEQVGFALGDYRELQGPFDRIVSVGMFEHVGTKHYPEFFRKVRDLLTPDGVALVHSIGRSGPPSLPNPWFRKYIFPGAYIPALSEVLPAVERSGLWVTDIEILRLHYAETLRRWRQRFEASCRADGEGLDERFRRMWRFYLTASEVAFRFGELMVFQLQLGKTRDAVPWTREYMQTSERPSADERRARSAAE